MGVSVSKDVPEVAYNWTYRAKKFYNDTVPVVSGDGSTVALYSRGERLIHILDSHGTTLASIPVAQKVVACNVSAIPSLSNDGSRIVTRDANSVKLYDRAGNMMWEYERNDKVVRSGMQSWIAQISGNGKVVIVRMFHECIWIDADTGSVMATTEHVHQMAHSIPRISDDGSTVVVADGPVLFGYVDCVNVWSAPSPVKPNLAGGEHWGDPGLSGDGSTVGVVGKHSLYIFNAKTGQPMGQVAGVRHMVNENSCMPSFSHDGKIVAVTLKKTGIAVFGGPGYSKLLMKYVHEIGRAHV